MRARPLLLTAGIVLASLADLFWRGRGAVQVVDTNLSMPAAPPGSRTSDLVTSTATGRTLDLTFSPGLRPRPSGARLEVALSSAGRTRILVVRRGRFSPSVAEALRDVLSRRATLRIVPDGGWVDLGLAGDEAAQVQLVGVLPGPFGLEVPRDQRPGGLGGSTVATAFPTAGPPAHPFWRLVVPRPVPAGEALARVFFFVRRSGVLAAAGLLAVVLLAAGTSLLLARRPWAAAVALVSAATLFHAVLLPPFQGADETSHAATVEAVVFRGHPVRLGDPYPRSFSRAAAALEQDRVQFRPEEPLPLEDAGARARLDAALASIPPSDALAGGVEPPAATLEPADRRALLFFRAYGPLAVLLRPLPFLDRVSAYRLLASTWGLLLFAAGAALLRRAGASTQVAASYGLVALLPYGTSTMATCSNYAPAVGLGQLLAAAACAAVLARDAAPRRLASAVFLTGAWTGVLLWTDFVFPAVLGTLVLASLAGARLAARVGLSRRARIPAAALLLVLAAAGGIPLLHAAERLAAATLQVPRNLGRVGPKTAAFMVLLALSPPAFAFGAARGVRRLARKPESDGRAALASFSIALAFLTVCAFLLTSWAAVDWSPFPAFVAGHVRAFLSNAFAWDQDRISWKFWVGAFGWHDAFYPDVVYAAARWGFVALAASSPLLAAPFLLKRPGEAGALLLVSGAACGCGIATFTLRYLVPTVPYGRFLLPLFALMALPLLVLLEAENRERWTRRALLAAAALQVWTAIVVLGARYAFGR